MSSVLAGRLSLLFSLALFFVAAWFLFVLYSVHGARFTFVLEQESGSILSRVMVHVLEKMRLQLDVEQITQRLDQQKKKTHVMLLGSGKKSRGGVNVTRGIRISKNK